MVEYRVEALAKGLRILSLFTEQRPTWRVSDIAPAVGMPLPTVYRVVMTLTAEGYLDHLPKGDYRPAVRVLTLGPRRCAVSISFPRLRRVCSNLRRPPAKP
ncbi:helix-turn-helix domain-containing protein [Actinoplanes sp. NPDC051513]|uniref:helix-turn-helix domain-containing protein n=1 Tax=Actinoplanes sp. NPDC051513 TaxID=3363908 RepID=UPI0037B4820D